MIPEFFQSQQPSGHFGIWGPIIGIIIVFLGTCVGVEVRIGKDEDDL